jgi:foldase protein PrsA
MLFLRLSIAALALGLMGGAIALAADEAQPAPPAKDDNAVLVVVNGQNVNREALVERLMKHYGQDELQQLILDVLVRQAADKKGVAVTQKEKDEAVDREVQRLIDQEKQQVLQQYGGVITWEQYLKEMVGTTEVALRENKKKDILSQPDSDSLIWRSVASFKLAWLDYLTRDRYEVSHILVETEAEAKNVIKTLNEGKNFAEVAKGMSKDPYAQYTGGKLAMAFSAGDYKIRPDIPGPEFERVAMSLKVGEISAPVQSNDGWHVIKLAAKEDAEPGNFKDLEPEVNKLLVDPRTNNITQVYIWRLIRDSKIENKSEFKLKMLEQFQEREKSLVTPEKPAEDNKPEGGEGGTVPAAPEGSGATD